MSLIAEGFAAWRECRAEYDLHLYAAFDAAEEACRGALLNAEGRARHVDPVSLFMGPRDRAYRYASEELVEWWRAHPRVTFADFEKQWAAERETGMSA